MRRNVLRDKRVALEVRPMNALTSNGNFNRWIAEDIANPIDREMIIERFSCRDFSMVLVDCIAESTIGKMK